MQKNIKYEAITGICKECGKEFTITPTEQKRLHALQFELPKRCLSCRQKRKKERDEKAAAEQALIEAEERKKKWEEDEKKLSELLLHIPYRCLSAADLKVSHPEKTLFIIGNGFDIMHGVPSSYWEFQKTLGKNSELRFHLETYLNAKDLWSNFEDSLSHLDAGRMLDVMDMWLDIFDAYNSDKASDFHIAIDTAMLPIYVLTDQLPKRFRNWVETLKADGRTPLKEWISKKALYLNFNYTDFLEVLYGVPADRIKYIHGCRKKVKYQPKEKLILGHVPNVDYLKDYKPNRQMTPRYKRNPYRKYMLESAMEIGTANWIKFYEECFTKHTPEIIEENREFFAQMVGIEQIIVIGHSLSEVDYPYFQEIIQKNGGRAEWFIGYHTYEDMERLLKFAAGNGLDKEKVTVFRT